tara:strand:+ start:6518 stop:7177 length:660 start_codon:yes stop_codon:yes gene_type:complete
VKIFIGYEEAHPEMYDVCKASIKRFSTTHEIYPLRKKKLGMYKRPYQGEATDFAFTRFLVPFLSDYRGWSLFCDGDFMWRSDPQEVLEYVDDSDNEGADVLVVKHPELITTEGVKMDGKVNRPYPFKYWSSLMLMNCKKLKNLTAEYVNEAPAGDLHGFKWTDKVGNLPATFNNMVGYYDIYQPSAVHFTDGGPWLKGFEDQPYADEWRAVLHETQRPV